jgi:hypothetical protein
VKTPLYRFLHSDRILRRLYANHPCGWFDGGCLILAQAVRDWLCAELVFVESDSGAEFDHAAVAISNPQHSGELLFIDGDGVSTELELLDRWRWVERLPKPRIRRFVKHPFHDRHLSGWLCGELLKRFGIPEDPVEVLGRPNLDVCHCPRSYARTTANLLASPPAKTNVRARARSARLRQH